MSQAGQINSAAGPVPPAVATSYVTDLNSPAIPAANVLNVLGDDSVVNNTNGIYTDGSSGGNTLTIYLSNRVQSTATTNNATPTDVIVFPLGATPGTYIWDINVTAFNASTPAGAGYTVFGTTRTTGAAAVLVGTPDKISNEEAALLAANVALGVSGNNAVFTVTGVVGLNINWRVLATYSLVT